MSLGLYDTRVSTKRPTNEHCKRVTSISLPMCTSGLLRAPRPWYKMMVHHDDLDNTQQHLDKGGI